MHPFTYKKSRRGDAEIGRAATHVLAHVGAARVIVESLPYGYDERRFRSQASTCRWGFMRSPHGQYREYHTLADDLMLITPAALGESSRITLALVNVLEDAIGGELDLASRELAMLLVLKLSDGTQYGAEDCRAIWPAVRHDPNGGGPLATHGFLEAVA